jgi:hypothetical protein
MKYLTKPFVALGFLFLQGVQSRFTCTPNWGHPCTFAQEPMSGFVALEQNEEQYLTTIPANKEKIYIKLSGNADLDLKISLTDGTVLVYYNTATAQWIGGCVACAGSMKFKFRRMSFETCVDRCRLDKTVTYRDGTTHFLDGEISQSSEWIYIDLARENIIVSVVAYGAGEGTIEWMWWV